MPSAIPPVEPSKHPRYVSSYVPSLNLSRAPNEKSLGPSKYPSSILLYAPRVNPSRAPSEQQVGDLQEESREILEQRKALENITA